MSFGNEPIGDDESPPMAEINMTPLVDVMLVLLIVFMITIPVMQHAVKVDLPQASSQRNDVKPESINLSIAANGQIYWNNSPVDLNTCQSTRKQPPKRLRNPRFSSKQIRMCVMKLWHKCYPLPSALV